MTPERSTLLEYLGLRLDVLRPGDPVEPEHLIGVVNAQAPLAGAVCLNFRQVEALLRLAGLLEGAPAATSASRLAFAAGAASAPNRSLSSPDGSRPPPSRTEPASPGCGSPAPEWLGHAEGRTGSQAAGSTASGTGGTTSCDSVDGVATATVGEGAGAVTASVPELLAAILMELRAIRSARPPREFIHCMPGL